MASSLSPAHRAALQEGAIPVPPDDLAKLEAATDPDMQEILAAAANLSDGGKQVLSEFLLQPEGSALIETMSELEETLGERSVGQIAATLALGNELDPYGESSGEEIEEIKHLLARGTRVLAEETQAREDLYADLTAGLGARVTEAGGRIESGGRIVFPDTFLFTAGSHDIRPRFAALLNDLCPRWLAVLERSASRREIDEILIEGHSSSEWSDALTPQEAWVRNLDLSQRRAQAVLMHCLALVERTDRALGDWARARLAAIGYSSSRPVVEDDVENPRLSRRVVFGIDFNRAQLLEAISGASGLGDIGALRGIARVIDADTIEVRNHSVRLDGIDAPERAQHCARMDGAPWPCGVAAASALEDYLDGRAVVCEDLKLGLRRFRGRCLVDGEDIARWLARTGWAFAFTRYSDEYALDEAAARRERRGVWNGKPPIPPWEWRRKGSPQEARAQ